MPETTTSLPNSNNLHPVENTKPKFVVPMFIGIIVVGIVIGLVLSKSTSKQSNNSLTNTVTSGDVVGSTDTRTFRDTATGVLEDGGLNGEGTHKLTRDGGPSQTVYLISSVVDLDQFIGKKVEVWGETLKATKAPWLMDVGRVKLAQ